MVAPPKTKAVAQPVFHRMASPLRITDLMYGALTGVQQMQFAGLGQLMADQPPDLVISGINFGQNVGADVMISGTVGAATTAVRLGIPAIAISPP